MTAPTPHRAASAEERERLREALAEAIYAVFPLYCNNPRPKCAVWPWRLLTGSQMGSARKPYYAAADETIAGPLAPLLDRITAAEARAEELQGLLVTHEISADKLKGESADLRRLMAENVVIEVVDDDEQSRELLAGIVAVTNARNAAEANLLALSRMYGEACRDLMGEACGHRLFARMYGDACEALLAATADRDRLADEVVRLRGALGCHIQADAYRDSFPDNDQDVAHNRKSETWWRLMARCAVPQDDPLCEACSVAALSMPEVVAHRDAIIAKVAEEYGA